MEKKMREIKSRAWIKSKSIFYYDFAKVPYDVKMEGVLYRIFSGRMDKPQLLQSEFEENLFTGLQDITGKDIYEGDILQIETDKIIGVVHFNNAMFELNLKHKWSKAMRKELFYFCENENVKVIGNIYENPELIEASK